MSRPPSYKYVTGTLLFLSAITITACVIAAPFVITARRGPLGEAIIEYAGDTNAYFQIHTSSSATGGFSAVAVQPSTGGLQSWTNASFVTSVVDHVVYKVRGVPLSQSLDADADGMDDTFELQWPFLDPLDPSDAQQDEDGDALFNLGEFQFGTDPTDPDSDDDWVLDGYEVVQGTDPADPNDAPELEFRVSGNVFCVGDTNLQIDFGPYVADEVVISESPELAHSTTVALTGIFTYPVSDAPNGWRSLYARLRRISDGAESELIEQQFILDTSPPLISDVSPSSGTVTALEYVDLQGLAIDSVGPVQVLINGAWAEGVVTSLFHTGNIHLTNGLNKLAIEASDCAGNTVTQTISITRTTSGSNAPPSAIGNSFPQTHWDGVYSNQYSMLSYFNNIPQWDTEDGWRFYRDNWTGTNNLLTEVLKQRVTTCTYVPNPNCITDNATETSTSPQSFPTTFAAFGDEAIWVNRVSIHLPEQEWNRESFSYRDVLTFEPSNQTESVIVKFTGMGYRRPPGEPVYVDQITFRGNPGFLFEGQAGFNATVKPGETLRVSASDFSWPDHSYIGSRFDRRLAYGPSTKTKAHLLWFNDVEFRPNP